MEREIALEILIKWKKEKSYLNITLNQYFNKNTLSLNNKDFITRIVYGTVQNFLYLETIMKPYLKTRVKTFEKMLIIMSLYQHYFMDSIPDYAIVNEAVNIAKRKKGIRTAQFINAILNQCFSNEANLSNYDKETKLSIETSHPLWLVRMFVKQYGYDKAKKICFANNEVPYKTARINSIKTNKEELLKSSSWKEGLLSKDALYYNGGNIAHSKEYKDGLVTIQDESSQLVAQLLNPNPFDYVLDMCCAPGGKTTHLASIMQNKGTIEAFDLYEHKIELVNQNCQRLGITNVHTHVYDSSCLLELYQSETFDKILLDAPCSGYGVLSRKPEIKYNDSSTMDEIIIIQKNLLEQAYALLKKQGFMVYSTCTLNKKENGKQIAQFIEKHQDMIIIEERTILPYEYHSDGFYMCLLKKEG